MKSTLKFLIFLSFLSFSYLLKAQTITVQPTVSTEFNLYTDVSVWISAPAGQMVNAKFFYFTQTGDTLSTGTLSNNSLGISHQFVFDNIVVSCDSLWNGYVDVWLSGQDTIQSNNVSWSIPCAGAVAVGFSVEEIVDTGIVISLDYNSGGVLAGLYWFASVNNQNLQMYSTQVFGTGTYTDTLFVIDGQTYEVCHPEINNGVDVMFLPECISGEMDSFLVTEPVASLTASIVNNTIVGEVLVENSGDYNFNFVVNVERMLCDSSFELFEEFYISFNDEIIIDSVFSLPVWNNLPLAPAWRLTLLGANTEYEIEPTAVLIDVALSLNPTVNVSLTSLGNGYYNAVTTWNGDGAGNISLAYYVNDIFVEEIIPTQSPVTYSVPVQIGSYSSGAVQVVLLSNSCHIPTAVEVVSACSPNPTHVLETATNITTTSAQVQLAYVNFHDCVEQAMVGIILVGFDTIWTPLSVNTSVGSNYIIQLTNLQPGMTYVYLGVLYSEGQYFNTNFSLSFTTLSNTPIDPHFTNFNVNWDMSMLATLFMHYSLGDVASPVRLRVFHDGPNTPSVVIANIQVSNEFTSIDCGLSGQYGTHMFWAELYNNTTGQVYATTDVSIYTFQQPVGIQEIGQPVMRFQEVIIYDIGGRIVAIFPFGSLLQPELPPGIYVVQGRNEETVTNTKMYLH